MLTISLLDTILSSFPRRWGRNKPDPSAVHRMIRDRLGSLDQDEIHSVYDLALIIIDECSKVFFDRAKPVDQRPEVVDLFGSAISNVVSARMHSHLISEKQLLNQVPRPRRKPWRMKVSDVMLTPSALIP